MLERPGHEGPTEPPDLSVVVTTYNEVQNISACLESLRSQSTDRRFEVIVVDSSVDGTADLVAAEFPEARLFRFATRRFCGDARNTGIAAAKAPVVACIDADCIADGRWVDRICRAHQGRHLAVGGAIANRQPSSFTGWAAYFSEFSEWMPDTPEQWMGDVAGANMSYKIEAFERYGGFIEGSYCSDTEFHWRLAGGGHRLLFLPGILVSHTYERSWIDLLRHEFFHGRSFANVRVTAQRFSRWRRIAYAALGIPLALKRITGISFRNLANRSYLARCLLTSPLWIAGAVAWTAGECVGYLDRAGG